MKHRYIKLRLPVQNGTVERSHRAGSEQFSSRHAFTALDVASRGARDRAYLDNHERFSMIHRGGTPTENLATALQRSASQRLQREHSKPHGPRSHS